MIARPFSGAQFSPDNHISNESQAYMRSDVFAGNNMEVMLGIDTEMETQLSGR